MSDWCQFPLPMSNVWFHFLMDHVWFHLPTDVIFRWIRVSFIYHLLTNSSVVISSGVICTEPTFLIHDLSLRGLGSCCVIYYHSEKSLDFTSVWLILSSKRKFLGVLIFVPSLTKRDSIPCINILNHTPWLHVSSCTGGDWHESLVTSSQGSLSFLIGW